MKALLVAFTLLGVASLHAELLTEADAIAKVKELPEFVAYSQSHKYAFDDNELIKGADGSVWRVDVHTEVQEPEATHLALWNRFFVNALNGEITVWDRTKADGSVLTLKEWRSTLNEEAKAH